MALIVLRLAAALTIAAAWYFAERSSFDVLTLISASLAILLLLIGFGTRPVALVCALVTLSVGASHSGWSAAMMVVQGLNLIAIALLGAGAFSVDAHIFGRRVIKIDR